MKRKTLLLLMMIASVFAKAQQSCCLMASAESFAMLSSDKQFISAHKDPLPFRLANPMGKEISFKTADGKEGHGYEVTGSNKSNVIILVHEMWGLNDYIKQISEKFSSETGASVIAVDLFDGKIATTKDSAAKLLQVVKKERSEAIIKGALAYAGPKVNIGTVGWCFGGGWSLQASLFAGKQAKACVMYYGMPEQDLSKLKSLNAPVLFIFAEKDQWINKELVSKFESDMKSLNKKMVTKSYNADHAFANPSNPQYEKEFAEDAFKAAINHFKENLK